MERPSGGSCRRSPHFLRATRCRPKPSFDKTSAIFRPNGRPRKRGPDRRPPPERRSEASSCAKSGVPSFRTRSTPPASSRIMLNSDKAFVQAYNCQVAVEAPSQVIVAAQVSQAAPDVGHLASMMEPVIGQMKEGGGFRMFLLRGNCTGTSCGPPLHYPISHSPGRLLGRAPSLFPPGAGRLYLTRASKL